MRKAAAQTLLKAIEMRYAYDVAYMRWMLNVAPNAFFKFSKLFAAAAHCEAAPKDAYYAAKLVGALTEDCGPCVQLVVDMARAAGVAPAQIAAVLTRDAEAMSETTALGFRFAEAFTHRLPHEDETRDAVRVAWGEKAIVDLTLGCTVGRVFPMTKAGLGFAKECGRVKIGDEDVAVVKRAA